MHFDDFFDCLREDTPVVVTPDELTEIKEALRSRNGSQYLVAGDFNITLTTEQLAHMLAGKLCVFMVGEYTAIVRVEDPS